MNRRFLAIAGLLAAVPACALSVSVEPGPDGGDDRLALDAGLPDAALADDAAGAAIDAATAPLPCVEGDDRAVDPETGNCYMVFRQPRSWGEALVFCESLGGHLAVVTGQAENDLLTPLVGLVDAWMGGNDIAVEGDWVWITGEPMIYENWRAGEPNDFGDGEDCMILEGARGGSWDDRPCTRLYDFVCER
jgi:hypothetical protein